MNRQSTIDRLQGNGPQATETALASQPDFFAYNPHDVVMAESGWGSLGMVITRVQAYPGNPAGCQGQIK